jgi:hypothetical protein
VLRRFPVRPRDDLSCLESIGNFVALLSGSGHSAGLLKASFEGLQSRLTSLPLISLAGVEAGRRQARSAQ